MDEDEDVFGSNDQDKFYGICPGDNNFNHKLINITNCAPRQTLFYFSQPFVWFAEYVDHGDPTNKCSACNALLWDFEARLKRPFRDGWSYSTCCLYGKVKVAKLKEAPKPLLDLFRNDDATSRNFLKNIRTYNMMFAFTSMGGKVDHSVNKGKGPYCFRLHGQNYHRHGSLLPKEGSSAKFSQLYIYDTENEVKNRIDALRYETLLTSFF